jgi:hypothetical protein
VLVSPSISSYRHISASSLITFLLNTTGVPLVGKTPYKKGHCGLMGGVNFFSETIGVYLDMVIVADVVSLPVYRRWHIIIVACIEVTEHF